MKRKKLLFSLMALLLPLTVWAADGLEVKVTPVGGAETIVYAGENTKSQFTIAVTYGTQTVSADNYTVYYTQTATADEQIEVKNAGEYTAHILITKATDGLKIGDTQTAVFTVERRPLTKVELKDGVKAVTRKFNETDNDIKLTDFFDLTGVLDGDSYDDAAKCLELARKVGFEGTDAGTYRVSLAGKTVAGCNYTYNAEGVTQEFPFIIEPQQLTLVFTPHVYKGEAYDESEFEITKDYELYEEYINATDNKKFETSLTLTFSSDVELVNADPSYTLAVATDNKNYQIGIEGTATFEISKATLEITRTGNLSAYYGSGFPGSLTNRFTYSLKGNDMTGGAAGIGLSMDIDDKSVTNVGTYPIYPYVNGTKVEETDYSTALDNYIISYDAQSFRINKRPFTDPAENGFSYELAEEINLTYQGKDFEDQDLLVVKYGDNPLEAGKDYELVFTKVDAIADEAAKNAGDKFKITVKAIENGNFSGEYEYTTEKEEYKEGFTITRAQLTIVAPEDASVLSKVYDGEEIGDVTDLYSFTGLVGEDVDEETNKIVPGKVLKMFSSQKDANASYIVHVVDVIQNTWPTTTGSKELKNYNFKYDDLQTKKFTILAADFELDGSKEDDSVENLIAAYDGKEVNSVTVKNLMNYAGYREYDEEGNTSGTHYGDASTIFEAEQWYTLVLPFKVKVRELSEQLGYAIVNVPDEERSYYDAATNTNYVYYKLTMGEVPANTLMAFKVDDTKELLEGLTFDNGREIVAPKENTIVKGVEFVPVYKKVTFDNESEDKNSAWYLWPYAGKFYNMGTILKNNLAEEFSVYPLNGYVHTISPAAQLSIFMEEADGSTTAISAVTGEAINKNAEGWYTIGGMKLEGQPTQKGIYINNGKKVVIK